MSRYRSLSSIATARRRSGVVLGTSIPARMRESDGTVYYVDKDHPSASDANAGTSEAAPWATLAAAFRSTGSGGPANNGIVKVKKGATAYAGATVTRSNASEANLVTVEAYNPADRPVMNGKLQFNSPSSYWRVRNLIADGTGLAIGGSLFGADSSNHLEWYGCEAKFGPGVPGGGGPGVQGFQPDNCQFLWWVNCSSHDNGDVDARDHGYYVETGTDYYFWNCIAYGNPGYGWHIYNGTNATEDSRRVYLYNCLSDDNARNGVGRSGYIQQSDHADGSTWIWRDIHWYNCLSTNHIENSANYGWRIRPQNQAQATVDGWAGGFPKSSIESCLSFNNVTGTYQFTALASEASMLTVANLITGQDPLYVNQAARDYRLQAGSPALNAGLAAYCPPIDFNGNPRTQANIGPY